MIMIIIIIINSHYFISSYEQFNEGKFGSDDLEGHRVAPYYQLTKNISDHRSSFINVIYECDNKLLQSH